MSAKAEMGVKQYVGIVTGRWGRFMVFETGDSRFYLFSQLDPHDCATGLMFPVRKSELKPEVKWALARGLSFDAVAFKRYIAAGGKMRRGAPVLD